MAPPTRPNNTQEPQNTTDQPSSQTLTHKPDDKTRLASPLQGAPIISDGRTPASEQAPRPVSKPKPKSADEMADFVRDTVNDFGPDRYAFFIYLGMVGVALAAGIGFFLLSWAAIATLIVVCITFVIVSQTTHPPTRNPLPPSSSLKTNPLP